MRVVCDSCGATYKIPDTKLVKDVNRATCRKCGHRMLIRKPDAPTMGAYPSAATEEERTVIASAADLERRAREHLAAAQAATGTRLGARPAHAEEDPTIVKTLASAPGGGTGLPVARARAEVPAAPARIQRRPADEPPTTVSSSIERMPERHVRQSLGPAQPIPYSPRPPVEDGLKSGAVFDAPRDGPASFDSPRGAPASFDAPRGGGGLGADAARRAAAGRQAVVIDQAMRPPVPVAPVPPPAPAHAGFPNGGAGAAMPAPVTPVAAPPRRSAMGGVVIAVVLLALLGTAGAAVYIFTRTPVEESPERVDKVTTEQPAEAPPEAAPAEQAPPPEEPAPVEAAPEPTPAVAEAAPPPPVEPEPVAVEKAAPPPKSSSRSSSRSSSSRSSTASKPTPAPANAIEVPEPPPATKSVVAAKTLSGKPAATAVSDDDLLGGGTTTTPASKPAPAAVVPPPATEEEPAALDTLPLTVLDTIVRNNKNIKRCFFNEQQKTGVLPSVSVKMKIETSGSVSSAAIAEPAAQQGTELDACLAAAFKSLQFPAFKTPMGAVTYPFKF